jgi:hypothetical protein
MNASFATGAHVQTHSGPTSATRGAVSLSYGIGLTPGVLQVVKAGVGVSGTANASARSTNRVGDVEGGQVEVSTDTATLIAYRPGWSVRLRTDAGRGWDGIDPVPVEPEDGRRLLLALPDHYLGRAPSQITAVGTEGREHRLPAVYHASGLTGQPALFDRTVAALEAQGLSLPIGSATRRELLYKLRSLPSRLHETVGTGQGHRFALHDRHGRPVATVELHTVRASRGERVGVTSDKAHLERVRTAIDGTGGSHTIGNSSTLTLPSAELSMLPVPSASPAPGVGVSASLSLAWSNSDGISAGRTGLWVLVSREVGHTAAYRVEFTHSAVVAVRGGVPVRTPAVPGQALVRLPEPDAFAYGFPVDEEALRGTVVVETGPADRTGGDREGAPTAGNVETAEVSETDETAETPEADETPETPGTAQEETAPSRRTSGEGPWITELGTVTDPAELAVLAERGEPVRASSVTEVREEAGTPGADPVVIVREGPLGRTVDHEPGLLRGTGRDPDDPEQVDVPAFVTEGRGIGTGLVDVAEETASTLYRALARQLTRLGFLPEDHSAPLAGGGRLSDANAMDSRLTNLDILGKYLSVRGLETLYDDLRKTGGFTFTLYRHGGTLSADPLDAAEITIEATASGNAPPRFAGSTRRMHLVNLAMGMDTAGQSTGGSTRITAGFRGRATFNPLKAAGTGVDLYRQVGAAENVLHLDNAPELLEYHGRLIRVGLVSDYTVTVRLRHSGVQGRLRPGARDPEPISLPRQEAMAYLLPLGDPGRPAGPATKPTPPSVLDRAVVHYADTSGLREAAGAVLGDLTGPQGHAGPELASFTSTTLVRGHLKQILGGHFTTDQFFEPGWFGDTFGAVDIRGTMGPSVFAGSTEDPFVMGVIRFGLNQVSTTDITSHGLRWVQADVTVGGPVDSGGTGFLQGQTDAGRGLQWNTSTTGTRAAARELIQLDFNRAYAYRAFVDFTVTGRREEHGKLRPQTGRSDRREVRGREVVYLLSEPEALARYAAGDLPVPDARLADGMNRWYDGELRLSGNTVAGVLTRWTAEVPEPGPRPPDEAAQAAADALDALAVDRRALAEALVDLHRNGALPVLDARTRAGFAERFALDLAEPGDAFPGTGLPEYLTRQDPGGRILGHSGVHAVGHDDGRSTFDIVRDQVDLAAPGLLASRPELWAGDGRRIGRLQGGVDSLQALLADGRGATLWEDLLSPAGQSFYLVNPIGWLLSDVVEIKLSAVLESAPEIHDFRPGTGLENYTHAATATAAGASRAGATGRASRCSGRSRR